MDAGLLSHLGGQEMNSLFDEVFVPVLSSFLSRKTQKREIFQTVL